MVSLESKYVVEARRNNFPSSSFRSTTRLKSANLGMHTTIAVKTLLETLNLDAVVDLLYVIEVPFSAYVDVHEIESRFDFPWHVISIHALSDNVDYESIDMGNVSSRSVIGIEFVAVPFTELKKVDGLYQWTFDLPIHLRYQKPAQNSSNSHGSVNIQAPSVYFRVHRFPGICTETGSDERFCSNAADVSLRTSRKRRYKRYYDVSFLGNRGNSDSILTDMQSINPYFDITAAYERSQELSFNKELDIHFANYSTEVILSMPLGNMDDLQRVLFLTMTVTVLTTVGLIVLMIRKALGRSRKCNVA